MKTLYQSTLKFLKDLGYRLNDTVWMLDGARFGFVVSRSYRNPENDEKIHLQLYHALFAESGYYLEATESAIAEQFILNVHFLNQCEMPKKIATGLVQPKDIDENVLTAENNYRGKLDANNNYKRKTRSLKPETKTNSSLRFEEFFRHRQQ